MKVLTLLLVILFFCSFNTYANGFKFISDDNKITTKICIAAASDNTEVMISKIRMLSQRGTALSVRSFINTLRCNNQYIGNFARTYNAQSTFIYLDKYTNRDNKKRQSNITISDIAIAQEKNNEKNKIVLVSSY